MADKQGAPSAPAPRYERGFLTPEQEKKVSLLGLGGAEGIAELLNPYPMNLETGERELAAPGLFEGIASAGKAIAGAIKDPIGTYKKVSPALEKIGDRMMQAPGLVPGQMAFVDGELRPLTSEEVVQERIDAGMDPTVALAGAAPIAARTAKAGVAGLMPDQGTVSAFGVSDPIKGKADVTARRTSTIGEFGPKVTSSTPFYSAADNWVLENVTSEVSVDKLKKQINKDKNLNEMDRAMLFDYIDNAQETKTFTNQQGREVTNTVVTPSSLKEAAEVRSIIPELQVRTFEPITPSQVENTALSDEAAEEIIQTLQTGTAEDAVPLYEGVLNQRYINVDNPSGKLEVGYITVSAPKETIEQASKAKLDAMKEARLDEIMPLKRRQDEILAQIDAATASNQDRMQQFALNFPNEPTRDIVDIEPLLKESARLEEQINSIMVPKDFGRDLEFPYKGSTRHRTLEGEQTSNLIFSRFVNQVAETKDGESLSTIRLLDLQSDIVNDAKSARNIPDLIPGINDPNSPAYRTLQKAAIKEAVIGAVGKRKNAVVLPHESSSARADLYRSGRMKTLAEQTAKELGEGFRVEELKVRNQRTMQDDWELRRDVGPEYQKEKDALIKKQEDLLEEARIVAESGNREKADDLLRQADDIPRQIQDLEYIDPPEEITSQWAIVFDPKEVSGQLQKENVKFRTGGLVTLPKRGRDGIADVIRKYRREGMMD